MLTSLAMTTRQKKRTGLWLLVFAAFSLLAWLPTSAQAQVLLTLAPDQVLGLPGQAGLSVFGSVSNSGSTSVDIDNAYFTLFSGPDGTDLTSAFTFSGYEAPLTLDAKQVYTGALFTLDADPSALLGTYNGNFSVSYSGDAVGQDTVGENVTFSLGATTPVPEASSLPLLALGCAWIGGMLWLRKKQAQDRC